MSSSGVPVLPLRIWWTGSVLPFHTKRLNLYRGLMIPTACREGGIMMLIHESPPDLVDQEASVVPGGAAYVTDLRGRLSPAERKNSWQLAEVSGDATPYAFQHLLRRALWGPEAVRDELRHDIVQPL